VLQRLAAVRQAINDWMRTSKEFDAVLDFDAAFRDPAAPKRMKEAFQAGESARQRRRVSGRRGLG
jgi:hypothetical protein